MNKLLREGEAVRFGWGFVRYRPEIMMAEVAPMPLNWLIRFVVWLMHKSHHPMTRAELRTLKATKALMIEAEAKGRDKGWREGYGDAWKAVTKIYMEGAYAAPPLDKVEK